MRDQSAAAGEPNTPPALGFAAVIDLYVQNADDPSAVHSLIDELDIEERRDLIVHLFRVAGLLELMPVGVDTGWYLHRMLALSSDNANPWSPARSDRR